MKKILTALILLFSLASCEKASDGNQVTISKDEYQKLKGDTSEYPKPFKLHTEDLSGGDDGIVLGSDKHEYLVWNYGSNSCNVEHYIDCKLCKERESLIK